MYKCTTAQSPCRTTTGRNNKLIPQAVLINHHFVVVQEATNCVVNCFSHHSACSMCNNDKMPTHTPFYFIPLNMLDISHPIGFNSREKTKKTNKSINFPDCDVSVDYAISHFTNLPFHAVTKMFKIENIFKSISNTIIMHSNIHHAAWRAHRESNQIMLMAIRL